MDEMKIKAVQGYLTVEARTCLNAWQAGLKMCANIRGNFYE
jgi:hypothetical protein